MRRSLAVALLLTGCTFDKSAPEGSSIVCGGDAECPVGWFCLGQISRCISTRRADSVPPTLTATIVPAVVRPDNKVRITVTADEPLVLPPELSWGAYRPTLVSGTGPQ